MTPPDKFLRAKILDRRSIADDLFLLHVDPGGPFPYLAGQYATIGVELDGKRVERAYSLCSSPYENVLEFFVERVPNGEFTPLLYALDEGAPLLLRRFAKGRFTLDLRSGRKNHLLLATVTGVAPYVSYIRTLREDWKKGGAMPGEHRLFCVQGASRGHEFGYRDELGKYASEAPWLKYVPTVSRPWEDSDWKGEIGRVDELIRKYADMWGITAQNGVGYLCGHPEMIEHSKGILQRVGFTKEFLREEIYWIPSKESAAPTSA